MSKIRNEQDWQIPACLEEPVNPKHDSAKFTLNKSNLITLLVVGKGMPEPNRHFGDKHFSFNI